MEEVHLQSPGDIIGAVAVGRVGSGPDGVLHDPDVVGQGVEMLSADRMDRGRLRH
jgi:hypothetical protein